MTKETKKQAVENPSCACGRPQLLEPLRPARPQKTTDKTVKGKATVKARGK